jgi:hypothetical protein
MPSSPVSIEKSVTTGDHAIGEGFPGWPAPLILMTALLRAEPKLDPTLDRVLDEDEWDRFADLVADRHRIAPAILGALVATGITPPERVMARLTEEVHANAFMALAHKAETARLISALAERHCDPMILKGWPLAEELLGTAAGRHSKDIDLYISVGEVGICLDVLGDLGYAACDEHRWRASLIDRPALLAECNDVAVWNEARQCQVEVHWRSNHFRWWADLSDTDGEGRSWPLDKTSVKARIPSQAANFVYLALHGQQHSWARLKWLHDIALILRHRDDEVLAADLEIARRAGAGRAAVTAVHLAHRVFGDPLPVGWPEPDWIARRMLRRFARGIAADSAAPGTLRARFDFYWAGLLMAEGTAQRVGVLRYAFWRGPRLFVTRLLQSGGHRGATS